MTPLEDSLLLQKLFYSRNPHLLQSILAPMANSSSMDQIAMMPDKIIEFSMPPTKTAGAGSLVALYSQQSFLPTSSELLSKIEALSRCMDSLC